MPQTRNLRPLGPVQTSVRGAQKALDGLWDQTDTVMRAYTGNIVALTEKKHLERVQQALSSLGGRYAGRQIIGVMDGDETVAVEATLVPQDGQYLERLILDANPEQLQGAILPLLRPATANHVWWASDGPPGGALLAELAELADQVIADTLTLNLGPLGPHCSLADLGWARAASWREATAQFFDVPGAAAQLPHIERLTVKYAGQNPLPAKLFAGWIASRLGWSDLGRLHLEADPASTREDSDLAGVELAGGDLADGDLAGTSARFALTPAQGDLVHSVSAYGDVRREAEVHLPPMTLGEGLGFVMARPEQSENFLLALEVARRLP